MLLTYRNRAPPETGPIHRRGPFEPRMPNPLHRIAPAALLLFAAVAGLLPVRSVDLFWHLAAGRWMLEHRALPRIDPFRFTSRGVPWVDHEWGFQLLLGLGERLGGLDALTLGRAAVPVALAALLWIGLRRQGVDRPEAVGIALVALLGVRGRLLLRPELASLLAFALLLLLLGELGRRGGWKAAAALLLLVALWTNLHPGVLAAPPLVGAYLLGAWIEDRRENAGRTGRRGRIRGWQVVALPALAAGAILLNPWGYQVFLVPLEIARALEGLPASNPDWAPLWQDPPLLLAAALAGLALLLVRARRRGKRLDLALGLVVLALLALTLTAVRHQGMLWVAGALLAGSTVGRGKASDAEVSAAGAPPEREGRRLGLATGLCLAATLWCLLPAGLPLAPTHRAGLGILPGRFPAAAVEALAAWEPVGPLYNSAVFGGYLLWRLYPPRQVFYDTRNEVNPGLLREVATARTGSAAWEALLARYGIDAALVRYEDRLRPAITPAAEPGAEPVVEHHTASALLFPPERFALVFWDDVAMLFLTRSPERAPRLAREEYRFVQPEDWRHTLERAAADPAFRRGAARELERKLRQDPGCSRAAGLLQGLRSLGAP